VVEVNGLEKTVLKYLEERDGNWSIILGDKSMNKEDVIKKFKRDRKFRGMLVKAIIGLATEMFMNHED